MARTSSGDSKYMNPYQRDENIEYKAKHGSLPEWTTASIERSAKYQWVRVIKDGKIIYDSTVRL